MSTGHDSPRRAFLRDASAIAAGVTLLGWSAACAKGDRDAAAAGQQGPPQTAEDEVAPAEDLMREHGVLKRVLLVYREGIRRLDARADMPPDVLTDSAKLIKRFIEEYHEKQEENYLFPRFEKANQQVDWVRTLRLQHERGRQRTDRIIRLATPAGLTSATDRAQIIADMSAFVRMYEPHEAREDTVLFPAFKKLVTRNEYDALGEQFEKNEHEMFGQDGFDMAVDQVAGLEKKLGIYDLAQFTPPALSGEAR